MHSPASFGQRNHSTFLQVKAHKLSSSTKAPRLLNSGQFTELVQKEIIFLALNRQLNLYTFSFPGIPNFPTILRIPFFPECQLLLGVCACVTISTGEAHKQRKESLSMEGEISEINGNFLVLEWLYNHK